MSAGLVATVGEPGNRKPFENGPEPVEADDQKPGAEGDQLEHGGQDAGPVGGLSRWVNGRIQGETGLANYNDLIFPVGIPWSLFLFFVL